MAQSLNNPEQQVHDALLEEISALANFQVRMKAHNRIMRLSDIIRRGDTLDYKNSERDKLDLEGAINVGTL